MRTNNMTGSEGLIRKDLTIPQGATFGFAVEHTDSNCEAVQHAGWAAFMKVDQHPPIDLSDCVNLGSDGVVKVVIPDSRTKRLSLGIHGYDVMLKAPSGAVVRFLYGNMVVVDTYAMDTGSSGDSSQSGVLGDDELDDILGGNSGIGGSGGNVLADGDLDDILGGGPSEEGAGSGSGGGAAATGNPSENVLADDELLDILNG